MQVWSCSLKNSLIVRGKFILINFCLKTIINQKQGMCHFMVRGTPTHCWPELRQHLVERTNYFSYMQRLAYVNVNPVLASPTQRQQKQCVGEGWGCFLLSRWKILCSLEELLTVLENKSYWVSLSLAYLEQRKNLLNLSIWCLKLRALSITVQAFSLSSVAVRSLVTCSCSP